MRNPDPLPLLFDLDGTLVDSLPDIAASTNALRGHYGLPEVPLDAVRQMIGDGLIQLLERALADSAVAVDADTVAVYRAHYTEQCVRLTVPFPGVHTRLAAWHGAGHPMAVVTNKSEDFTHRILRHLDLARFFPVVIGGDTLPVRKPDPAPVRAALERLRTDPARGLMVGDSVGDIRAGQGAGIRTAAALFGYQPESVLRAAGADEYWPAFGVGHMPECHAPDRHMPGRPAPERPAPGRPGPGRPGPGRPSPERPEP